MAVYYNDEGELKLLAGSTNYQFCPIGSILPFGGTIAPNGFFLCQGQALSRTDYKELFGVIGTSFGVGDGSTTFNLPDLRGEFLRGAGTNSHTNTYIGELEGSGGAVGEHQNASALPAFNVWHASGTTWSFGAYSDKGDADGQHIANPTSDRVKRSAVITNVGASASGSSASNGAIWATTRPTNTSVNYIIKAKVVGEGDSESGDPGYSTSEIDTGKTWIDGKKIYRKVLTSTTPATGNETYPSNTNNDTIYIGSTCDTILDISGYIQYANNVSGMINVPTSSSQWVLLWGRGNEHSTMPNSLGIAVGTTSTNLPITIIVEYTK